MPLYEYVCSNCGALFEHWVRSASVKEEIVCPHCQSVRVDKKFSTFGVKGGDVGGALATGDNCSTGGG
ncbi:MAG: zinc ribbon domain-containing protein [Caldilinea sp.]|nr:zinc ribbon domain-containing protein [Caldilinea sp.]MDW8441482.1 zinc ribbon domain-containing protein [Caldilineaceae bacterium]